MEELLKKTQEEIELTLLNGLYEYLKEHKFFERKGMFLYEKEDDLIDKVGFYYSPENIYGYEDIALSVLREDEYKKHIKNCGGLIFENYDEYLEYVHSCLPFDYLRSDVLEHFPWNISDIKYLIDKNNLTPADLFETEDLAKALENKGWRTLNKEENLKPNDLFTDDELEEYFTSNYDISNAIENGLFNYEHVRDYVLEQEGDAILDNVYSDDILDYVRNNYYVDDLVEWK